MNWGSTRGNNASHDARPCVLNGENDVELVEEDTGAWVQRTFYKNSNKEGYLGGKTRKGKSGEKWRALDLLNKVERIKRRKKSLSGYQLNDKSFFGKEQFSRALLGIVN